MSYRSMENLIREIMAASQNTLQASQVFEQTLVETHFKVGDEVKCKDSGMEGEVIAVDPEMKGKYYTVKREDGKTVKYAANELDEAKLTTLNKIMWKHNKDMHLQSGTPAQMKKKHRKYDTNTLKTLLNKDPKSVQGNSPAALQQRIIRHELKMRGELKEEVELEEKSMSKAQQKAAGAALAAKRGEGDPDKLQGASKEMYKSMTTKELEDFAHTKHKGLPDKKEEVQEEPADRLRDKRGGPEYMPKPGDKRPSGSNSISREIQRKVLQGLQKSGKNKDLQKSLEKRLSKNESYDRFSDVLSRAIKKKS